MNDRKPLRAGDIALIAFDPALGSEPAGVRPGLVISSDLMLGKSKHVIVCPITRNMALWPTKVLLPEGLKTKGMVLTEQVRSIDEAARVLRTIENAGDEFTSVVRQFVARLIGFDDVYQ